MAQWWCIHERIEEKMRSLTLRSWEPTVVAAVMASFALLAPVAGEGSLSIKPAFIEVELGKTRPSETIHVENITKEEARYRVRVVHFVYDEGGNIAMVPPDPRSMAPWIKCNPLEFTLPPKSARAIRLTIIPPKSLDPGDYWAAIWFEPLSYATSTSSDGQGRKVSLKVQTNILIPVLGQVPGVAYKCDLTDVSATKNKDGIAIAASLANQGSGRVKLKGNYEILDAANSQIAQGLIGDDVIMAGGKRTFKQQVKGDFPAGDYVVRVTYTSAKLPAVLAGQTHLR
jgi:hypothetical protein